MNKIDKMNKIDVEKSIEKTKWLSVSIRHNLSFLSNSLDVLMNE
jgi:hypothetical protein